MIGHQEGSTFALVPSGEPNIFHLTADGKYVGTVACDSDSLKAARPWGWRLMIGDSLQEYTPTAGRSHDVDEALADAKRAYERHQDMLMHRL